MQLLTAHRCSQEHNTAALGNIHLCITTIQSHILQGRGAVPQTHHLNHPPTRTRIRGRLQCLPGCDCRCHSALSQPLVPSQWAAYIGQVHVSRRLSWLSEDPCDVQTCRGHRYGKSESSIQWILPSGLLPLHVQFSSAWLPFYISVATPRVISHAAPIWDLVWIGDVEGVRGLFESGQASVWDTGADGESVLSVCPRLCIVIIMYLTMNQYACAPRQSTNYSEYLEMIRFLVDAGASATLHIG